MALKFGLLIATCLTLVLAACGGSAAPAASTAEPAAAPTGAPTVARAAASVVASPSASASPSAARPAATTEPAARANTVYVGNTDSQGVFIRKTPVMADRLRAYPDGTALTIAGDDVDGDGQHWRHVKTPDGVEGYVPAMYTVETPP
jgi:outer membrane receptor protein involved in Fe transport